MNKDKTTSEENDKIQNKNKMSAKQHEKMCKTMNEAKSSKQQIL